jgi:hypothetical protein
MRKTKKNGKRNTLAKIRRKLYSKRKGRGIEASKISAFLPSKIPISREEVLRMRRERKTLKRETRAAEKAIATQRTQEDAIINKFLTDIEASSARRVRYAAREELEKAKALSALKEQRIPREEVLRLRRERKTLKKETRAAKKAETATHPTPAFTAWQERNQKRIEAETARERRAARREELWAVYRAKPEVAPVVHDIRFWKDGVRLVRPLFGTSVKMPDRAIDVHKQVIYNTADER